MRSRFVSRRIGGVLKPVRRQSVADAVFEQLRDQIVGGEMRTGTTLPPERELAKLLGVNRQAVREALKRLEQMRLVSIQHGGGTTVADFRVQGHLDLLEALVGSGEAVDTRVLRSIMEMRSALSPDIARLAARRASSEVKARLRQTVETMGATEELPELQVLALRFWTALVDGSGNLAYRLAHNTLRAAYEPFLDVMAPVLEDELRDRDTYRAIARAVEEADEAAAETEARALSQKGEESLSAVASAIEALAATKPDRD